MDRIRRMIGAGLLALAGCATPHRPSVVADYPGGTCRFGGRHGCEACCPAGTYPLCDLEAGETEPDCLCVVVVSDE